MLSVLYDRSQAEEGIGDSGLIQKNGIKPQNSEDYN